MTLDVARPLSGGDLLVGALVAAALVAAALVVWRRGEERGVYALALVGKLVASVATVAIFVLHYGANDNISYHEAGVEQAEAIRRSPAAGLMGHLGTALSLGAAGGSTERMVSASAVLHVLAGDSFLGVSVLFGALGLVGQVLLYRTFVSYYPQAWLRRWWRLGVLFLPSLVLWSSGLFKDTVGVFGLGCAVWGLDRFARRGGLGALGAGGAGIYAMLLYRPQILPALLCALVPWMLVGQGVGARAGGRSTWRWERRRLLLVVGIVAGMLALFLLGLGDARLSPARVAEGIAFEIAQGERRVTAGSNLEGPLLREVTWWRILAAWPAAVGITLFRPFIWEAPGALGLAAAAENAVLLALCVRAGWLLTTRGGAARRAVGAPLFLASVTFVAVAGLVIGVTQINLGTISRYRAALLPFAAAALAVAEHAARPGPARKGGAAETELVEGGRR